MSNKFRNILFGIGLSLIFTVFFNPLYAFAPERKDFVSKYQYDLYRSWINKGGFATRKSAVFAKDIIEKHFGKNDAITVLYILENGKIADQQESLSYLFPSSLSAKLLPLVQFVQSFVYRLNTTDRRFSRDILELNLFKLVYKQKEGLEAANLLWQDFENSRLNLAPLEFEMVEEKVIITSRISKIHELTMIFPDHLDWQTVRRKILEMETRNSLFLEQKSELIIREGMLFAEYNFSQLPSFITKDEERQVVTEKKTALNPEYNQKAGMKISPKTIPPAQNTEIQPPATEKQNLVFAPADTTREIAKNIILKPIPGEQPEMSLNDYFKSHLYSEVSRELLHNKISEPMQFLREEFSGYQITARGDTIWLQGKELKENFHADMKLLVIRSADGLEFSPCTEFRLQNQILQLSDTENIDLSQLTPAEAKIVASRLPQLIYEHRSLGTKLFNFLLIHDDIPSTLIIQNSQRSMFEKTSYADLLLLLNRYWEDCHVYFKIENVKKVNGAVEMLGYLIANNEKTNRNDIAEIRFLLDDNYTIDLILMILHPNAQI
jgi:hypothetical protein